MASSAVDAGTLSSNSRTGHVAGPSLHMSWGPIFGGAVSALAIWLMLYALGLAMGLSSIDASDPGSSLKASSIFTGIWGLVVPLIALFVGGMVASRGAGATTKMGGALHGLVMWGLTTLAGAWLLTSIISSVVGGVASVGKTAVQAGAGVLGSAAGQAGGAADLAQTFGLNADDALRPVNQRLKAEGKPAVSADQLQAAAKDVVKGAVSTGRLDRELLVTNLAKDSSLSRQDAEEIATRVETQFNATKTQVGEKVSSAKQSVQEGALKAADATGKVFWGIFGALFFGMLAALLGATMGASQGQRVGEAFSKEHKGSVLTQREVRP